MFPRKLLWSRVIIVPIILALISYFIFFPLGEDHVRTSLSNRLIGKWESKSENVTIIFNADRTYISKNNGDTYRGIWEISSYKLGNYVYLNWEGFSAYYRPLFTNDETLRLVGANAPSGYIVLSKK